MTNNLKKPLVSVVIPAYNCEKFIEICLNSVVKQTFQDFEVIVVDDGSTDRTQDLCLKYCNFQPEKVSYYYQSNRGPSSARNHGIRLSRGKYLCLLDADDYWDENFLEIMLKELESSQSDIVVCYNYRLEFRKNILVKKDIETWIDKIDGSESLYKQFLKEDLIGGPSRILCKKSIMEDIGGYDEKLWMGMEWDLYIRFFEKERRISIVRIPLYYYHIRNDGSNMSRRVDPWQHIYYDTYLIYRKFKSSIHKDPKLKEAYSEHLWYCALNLYRKKTKLVWMIYFVLLSQRLHFSILGKMSRYLQRNRSLL